MHGLWILLRAHYSARAPQLGPRMITVVIPTLNAETGLAATLSALVPAAVEGLVREVIVVDGGSVDATLRIADGCGARIVKTAAGRGQQLAAGAEAARMPWLLFLHADTVPEPGWEAEASKLMERQDLGQMPTGAGVFRFALDDIGLWPRLIEFGVAMRCHLLRLPYGDQGLLVSKTLYREVGGYRSLPLMEDVDLVRRLGRGRIMLMRSRAITSAVRYRRDGYLRRSLRNLSCLLLFYLHVPAGIVARLYR